MKFQLVTGDNNVTESFRMIAGDAAEGTLLTSYPDPRGRPEAAELVAELRGRQFPPDLPPLYMYATIQVWAQAVEKAGTFEVDAVSNVLRDEDFDTVLGRIGFDGKGDVTGVDPFVWYVWKATPTYRWTRPSEMDALPHAAEQPASAGWDHTMGASLSPR